MTLYLFSNPFRVETRVDRGIFGNVEERKKLDFAVFVVHALAEAWKMLPKEAYRTLADCGALDGYVWPCYDVLHTMGRQALVEDLTSYAREKGQNIGSRTMNDPTKGDAYLAFYRENLEGDVISALAEAAGISLREAMDLYYGSALSGQIETGRYGIDNLSPKYLATDLLEHEFQERIACNGH